MPTLNWIGKDKVVGHHNDVSYHVLEHQYGYSAEKGQTTEPTHSGNMIIHGDNLLALKSLMPMYEGRIKCIYIDPPYNTGNENWVYNDNVNDPHIKKWLGEVVGKEGEDLSRHDKWLCMMFPRLVLMKKLLSEDGAIFISIGDDELSNLLQLMNEIFGTYNQQAIFVWKSRSKPSNTGEAKFKPQNDAEYIIEYHNREKVSYNIVSSGRDRNYPHTDKDGDYRLQTILKSNRGESQRDTMRFSIGGYTPPIEKRWQAGEETVKKLYDTNRITFETGEPMLKYYKNEEKEETAPFYCFVPQNISGTAESGKKLLNAILGLHHGFDTVKPLGIIEYILSHCTKEEDVILDCFMGSGSTGHSILELNKKNGGKRKFIMIDIMDYAETVAAERMRRAISGYPFKGKKEEEIYSKKLTAKNILKAEEFLKEAESISIEKANEYTKISKPKIVDNCLKVIGTKMYDDKMEGLGGAFDYYELGAPLFNEDGNLNEEVGIDKIREYIYYAETKQPLLRQQDKDEEFLLDECNRAGYYFYYQTDKATTLSYTTLANIVKSKHEMYIIYADRCLLDEKFMTEHHIKFKKIPRDIKRF